MIISTTHPLTLEQLKEFKPHEIFATGLTPDGWGWVAVRGGIHDWAIYVDPSREKTPEETARWGDKVHYEKVIREMVPCTDEAMEWYRH